MNSSVVVCLLRMKERLHRVDNLIFSISLTAQPSFHEVPRLCGVTLGELVYECCYLTGWMSVLLVYLPSVLKTGLNVLIFFAYQLEHKFRPQGVTVVRIGIQKICPPNCGR